MNIIKRLLSGFSRKSFSLYELQQYFSDFALNANSDPKRGWSFACIDRIAKDIASADIDVVDKNEKPVKSKLTKIIDTPNPYTKQEFLTLTVWNLELYGRCVWWVKDGGEKMILMGNARPIQSADGVITFWEYTTRTAVVRVPAEECIVFSQLGPDGQPRGTIQAITDAIDTDSTIWAWTRKILEKWYYIPFVVKITGMLDRAAYRKIQEEIKAFHEGLDKGGLPALVPDAVEFQQLKTPTPGDTLSGMPIESVRDRILGVFGVPASVLGLVKDVNRANAEANMEVYKRNTLNPRMVMIADILTTQLLPMFEKGENRVVLSLPKSPDPNDEIERLTKLTQAGIMTPNEARGELGLEPVDWGNVPLNILQIAASQGFYTPNLGKASLGIIKSIHTENEMRKYLYRQEYAKEREKLDKQAHTVYEGIVQEFYARVAQNGRINLAQKIGGIAAGMREETPGLDELAVMHARALAAGAAFGAKQTGKALSATCTKELEAQAAAAFTRARQGYYYTIDSLATQLMESMGDFESDEEFVQWLAERQTVAINTTAWHGARYAITSEFTNGQMAAFADGGVAKKIWLTTGDDRVRDTHMAMEGVAVGLSDDFTLPSGASGPAPGNLNDMSENWQCRCILAPEL